VIRAAEYALIAGAEQITASIIRFGVEGTGYSGHDPTISAKIATGSAPKVRTISRNSTTSTRRFPASYPETTDWGLPSSAANSTCVRFALRRAAAKAAPTT
jgi:hypothetical protein